MANSLSIHEVGEPVAFVVPVNIKILPCPAPIYIKCLLSTLQPAFVSTK
jgi:hypothetical protein